MDQTKKIVIKFTKVITDGDESTQDFIIGFLSWYSFHVQKTVLGKYKLVDSDVEFQLDEIYDYWMDLITTRGIDPKVQSAIIYEYVKLADKTDKQALQAIADKYNVNVETIISLGTWDFKEDEDID